MVSPQSDLIAAAHTARQNEITQKAIQLVVGHWAIETAAPSSDLGASFARWLAQAVPVILMARDFSARAAHAYYTTQRSFELPGEPEFKLPLIDDIDPQAISTSLWVTGPDRVKKGTPPEEVVKTIEGATTRHTMNGGRETIEGARELDKKLVGFFREINSANPCYFCVMLASRGVVFDEASFDSSDPRFTGPGNAKVHDECACWNRPSYQAGELFPGQTGLYRDLWLSQPKPRPGEDPVNEWRRFYEGRAGEISFELAS